MASRTSPDRLLFAVLVLAVYRMARALTVDVIGDPIRTWALARYGDEGIGSLASCPHCAGVWIAAGTTVTAACFGLLPWRRVPFWIAAVAGGQSLLATVAGAIEAAEQAVTPDEPRAA